MNYFKHILLSGYLLFTGFAIAQIRLPKIASSGMVLQRNEPLNIWGWASPGEKVTVKFDKKTYTTTAAKDSTWAVILPAQKAGGPYTMVLKGKNEITLNDILIGDVWICAGQSNMVHQMRIHSVMYAKEIAEANNTKIRQFFVPNTTNLIAPETDVPQTSWLPATTENIGDFSVVAYFFAKTLYEKYNIPIGIVNTSWGGTPIESWISESGFKNFADAKALIEKNRQLAISGEIDKGKLFNSPEPIDKGVTEKWYSTDYTPKGWHTIAMPGYWEDQGVHNLDGTVWYRREVDIPESIPGNPAKIFLGRIVDADVVYINGTEVGHTSYMYPQRRYEIPNGLLKPGKNLITIKVTNNSGKGGFVPDKPYYIATAKDTVSLTGYWQYKVSRVKDPAEKPLAGGINKQNQPTVLYNAMVAPFISYKVKGFIWYQGESNAGKANEYTALQTALIQDWRTKWNDNNLPFLFTQLPGYMDYNYWPSESQWALFREAQAKTLSVPNTAMAVTIDLGEWNDIHPDRKKEVGERLAIAARKLAYNEKIVAEGPVYKSSEILGDKITVSFSNANGLKTTDGEAPAEFAIAGEDKKFVWANAKIDGQKIVLWNETVPEPRYVRYAWADNPVNPNLVNSEELPMAPFRTDK
ncbi:sialate O-acetylesterase [Flavobacterium sp. RHBU_3]|uniref:sialate O-acetylesterase n=1 Tax=Flavobacterium sp. RHBU_3 TaxID=3391184 RepID=UPI00398461C5